MAGNYNEDNNRTGYPLSGGVKPTVSPDFADKYERLKNEYDALIVNFSDLRHLLDLEKSKNELLERQLKEYQDLLRLSMSNGHYARPLEFTYGNGPRDVYGNPIPYCASTSANQHEKQQNNGILNGLMPPKQ